jgi:membrane protein
MVGLGTLSDLLLRFGRWPALAVMILLGLAVLYRFAPSRRAPQWRWISVGSVAAAAIWLIGSAALSYYLANYGAYDAAYGSLGAAIGLMIWMWMSTIVVLVGAELNSEIEHQTARDSTEGGAEKPIGTRGAKMADSVGGAR